MPELIKVYVANVELGCVEGGPFRLVGFYSTPDLASEAAHQAAQDVLREAGAMPGYRVTEVSAVKYCDRLYLLTSEEPIVLDKTVAEIEAERVLEPIRIVLEGLTPEQRAKLGIV